MGSCGGRYKQQIFIGLCIDVYLVLGNVIPSENRCHLKLFVHLRVCNMTENVLLVNG